MPFLGRRIFGRAARKGFNRQATFRRARRGVYEIGLFAVFLTIATGLLDRSLFRQLSRQISSEGYVQGEGTVTQSRHERGTKQTLKIIVEVRYWVGTRMFVNSRWGYPLLSNRDFADVTVSKYPVDSVVAVFYDAGHPADVVLERGLRPIDLHVLFFAVPLNLVTVTAWLLLWGARIRASGHSTKRKQHRKDREHPWLMALSHSTGMAFTVLFFGSILSIFYTGWFTDLHGSLHATLVTWGVILGLCVLAFGITFVFFIRRNRGLIPRAS